MTIATAAVDASITALRQLNRGELITLVTYTAVGGSPLEAGAVIRRTNAESVLGSVGQQHEGARILLDKRDVVARPTNGATVERESERFVIQTAADGVRFWHCEVTT